MEPGSAKNSAADAAGFKGLRVVAFESRMAAETTAIIERFGGIATVAPAMREAALEDNHTALDFAARLVADEPAADKIDVVILNTGVGARALMRVMETRYSHAVLTAALARTIIVARGPKPVAALREIGLEPALTAPEPHTWREILHALSGGIELAGKCVAVQEYGVSNPELIVGLQSRRRQCDRRAGL